MKLKQLLPLLLLLIFTSAAFAQNENAFASIGKKGKVLTLTKGQYNETFDADSIQQIGSSLINIRTMKVVKLLSDDESKKRLEGEKHSRFLSVDPLTKGYPMLTPYQYASNSPIMNIDLDGLEGVKVTDVEKKTITVIVDVVYVMKSTKKEASSNVDAKKLERIKTNLNKELNKKSFKDEKTGFDVKFEINFTPMKNMGDVNMQISNNDDIQDNRMFLMMQDEKDLGIVTDADGNEYQVSSPGESSWRVYRISSSRNGHTQAHELFHNLIHNHKNAPEDLKNQIDPKNQKEGHKKAGGIFVYEDARDGSKTEDINQKNIQDVLRTVPEKEKEKPVVPEKSKE